jgi:hypothetical protein
MFKKMAFLALSLAAIATAQAHDKGPPSWPRWPGPVSAPEIDPASAMSAFTLLTGSLIVLRGRRSNKK